MQAKFVGILDLSGEYDFLLMPCEDVAKFVCDALNKATQDKAAVEPRAVEPILYKTGPTIVTVDSLLEKELSSVEFSKLLEEKGIDPSRPVLRRLLDDCLTFEFRQEN